MGILKSAADFVYTIRFLKLLTTPFEKMGAYEIGLIDKDGNVDKKRKEELKLTMDGRMDLSTHWTSFVRLVVNIKRLMAKAPGGKSVVARYGAALFLIKESGNLNSKQIQKIHNETGIDILDVLAEDTQWFMLNDKQLSPGVYRMKHDSMSCIYEETYKDDQIRILEEESKPVGEVLGLDIYSAIHLPTNKRMYVSTGDITK
tara:strand:+ start:2956 stop:3561 length:606 start_codon:yes stop_codon:yes gene_type:complete